MSTGVWYASDQAGMMFDKIPGPDGQAWSLLVSRGGLSERSTLYQNGVVKKTWNRTFSPGGMPEREVTEENGVIREELAYDDAGRPATERRFLEGGVVEQVDFVYESGRLRSKTTTLGDKIVGTVDYLYSPDGRLASAIESTGELWGNSSAKSGPSYNWRTSGDVVELRGYDREGRLVSFSKYAGSRRIMEERRFWLSGALERSIVTDADGTTTLTSYVADGAAVGKPSEVIVEKGGAVILSERMDFDESGKVARLKRDERGVVTVMEYQYDPDGTLVLERRSVNSSLVAVIRYGEPGARVEEAWDRGALYARITWEDGRKVLEEMIRDGVVLRSRSFK
ncbi:MAG: hypothetical protein CVV51_02895 [Spirochaetae bacterium HGW-Spirochaetae-7]|jgi:antitoxin component YwqK of YwqJK toxin-antitoxin module|nr:MAG: hypothetical protein CVV51_02895 [Spirochaetae bacterium HGW-Spirochaetae-7]